MDTLTLKEVRALIKLVKNDLRRRDANVSLVNLFSLENKLTSLRIKIIKENSNA